MSESSNRISDAVPFPGRIHIRSAVAEDLPAAVQCSLAAFTRFEVFGPPWYSDAGVLPALLQALSDATMRLAIDSKTDTVIGLAAWTESLMCLGGRMLPAAFLAPLAVIPRWQGHGVGAALMRDGTALLKQRRVKLLYILGHEAYYPRFGLLPGCHGRHAISVAAPIPLSDDPEGYSLRPLHVGDEAVCMRLWHLLCADVDGAVEPGAGLLPWASKTRGVIACMLERRGEPVAYARFDSRPHATAADGVLRFLAEDAEAATVLAGRILGWTQWQDDKLVVPLPTGSHAVRALFPGDDPAPLMLWWPPGLAMALDEGDADMLLRRIQAKEAPPLFIEWPALFDF